MDAIKLELIRLRAALLPEEELRAIEEGGGVDLSEVVKKEPRGPGGQSNIVWTGGPDARECYVPLQGGTN